MTIPLPIVSASRNRGVTAIATAAAGAHQDGSVSTVGRGAEGHSGSSAASSGGGGGGGVSGGGIIGGGPPPVLPSSFQVGRGGDGSVDGDRLVLRRPSTAESRHSVESGKGARREEGGRRREDEGGVGEGGAGVEAGGRQGWVFAERRRAKGVTGEGRRCDMSAAMEVLQSSQSSRLA